MCGIVGLYHAGDSDEVACDILEGLSQLQHRGQDGCGVVTTSPRGYCHYDRGLGLVTDVFGEGKSLDFLSGSVGLGHGMILCVVRTALTLTALVVRYRTAGSLSSSEAQPLRATGRREVYLVHVVPPSRRLFSLTDPGRMAMSLLLKMQTVSAGYSIPKIPPAARIHMPFWVLLCKEWKGKLSRRKILLQSSWPDCETCTMCAEGLLPALP